MLTTSLAPPSSSGVVSVAEFTIGASFGTPARISRSGAMVWMSAVIVAMMRIKARGMQTHLFYEQGVGAVRLSRIPGL